MRSTWLTVSGSTIDPDSLQDSRANQFVRALRSEHCAYAQFVDCRIDAANEIVVFDVEVELGQQRVHPIERIERIAVAFSPTGDQLPEVLALRSDFPVVPHLNLRDTELPRSLCLYDELWRDVRRRWTAPGFVETIRTWLALTARGELHADDQPLEPLLLGATGAILFPHDLFAGDDRSLAQPLVVAAMSGAGGTPLLVARRPGEANRQRGRVAVAVAIVGKPLQHGIIRRKPQTLADLDAFLGQAEVDLVRDLRGALPAWLAQLDKPIDRQRLLDAKLIVFAVLPKTRSRSAEPETGDIWAFATEHDIRRVGVDIGIWEECERDVGTLLQPPEDRVGANTQIDLLNPVPTLSRDVAARLNDMDHENPITVVAVGAGALGSQVILNLARAGFGSWCVVDNDMLLPHNVARHGLAGADIGKYKASALCSTANALTDGSASFEAIIADVISPGDKESMIAAELAEAQVILDMAASATVSRFLARDVTSAARRVSLFLNPRGQDMVLLAEDRLRTVPLDALEMQYYRALASKTELKNHFEPQARLRFGQSCRDVTSRIPQARVSLHAAIAADELQRLVEHEGGAITIWRANDDMSVSRIDVLPSRTIEQRFDGWTLVVDEFILGRLSDVRRSRLPNETGGVLVGSFDLERRIVYVIETIASPPDSTEWPMLYIRGCRGLKPRVEAMSKQTDGVLHYVGEWHSHPDGCSTCPSRDDMTVFAWITEVMDADGLPALMLIVGEQGTSGFIGEIQPVERLFMRKQP